MSEMSTPTIRDFPVFKNLKPVSAGFCEIDMAGNKITCFGNSHSLGLKADEKQDTLDATRYILGIDAMLAILIT